MEQLEARPTAFLTLDVEDWEHANFHQLKGQEEKIRSEVKARAYRMDANTDRWIELCAKHGAVSTCFVLGEFASRYPDAVQRLARAGHEIASHGATHDLIYEMSRDQFREFLRSGLDTVSALTGSVPRGFRAPSWSVSNERTPWFCEELERAGLAYDSSEFPVKTPLFGQPGAKLRPYSVGKLLRVPVTVLTAAGARFPFSSGAFFRLVPQAMIRFGLAQAARQKRPVMVVLHPRELDPAHPRLPLRGWERSVHYARLSTTIPKLEAVLPCYRWRTISESLPELLAQSAGERA